MGDYKRAAQMFLKFAGPMSPSGRAISFFNSVKDLEGSSPPATVTPSVRAMNKTEQDMAKQEMKQRRTVAKGGAIHYKSISDMESKGGR